MTTAAETKNDSVWHDMVTVELGEGQSVSCRYRELLRGVFMKMNCSLCGNALAGVRFNFSLLIFMPVIKTL